MTNVDSKPDPASFADQRQQSMVRNQPKPPTLRMVPEMSKAGKALVQESTVLREEAEPRASQPSVAEVAEYLRQIDSRTMMPKALCSQIDRLAAPPATIVPVAPVGLAFVIGVICAVGVGYLGRKRPASF